MERIHQYRGFLYVNWRLFLGLAFLLTVIGCGSSNEDFSRTSVTPARRNVTFILNQVQPQGTSLVPASFNRYEILTHGPDGRIEERFGAPIPSTPIIEIQVYEGAGKYCEFFLLEDDAPRLVGLFPLPPGNADVVFDRPTLNPYFGGYRATTLNVGLSQLPLQEDEPAKVTVTDQNGVNVTKDGEFEVDPSGALDIDQEGNVIPLVTADGIQITFRLRIPVFDLAVGCEDGPCVSLYDSSQMEKGPIRQFLPFGAEARGVKVAVGDYDADGDNDVACFADRRLRLFHQQGDLFGEFTTGTDDPLVAAGDLDGDGVDEIAVLDPEQNLATYLTYSVSDSSVGVREERFFNDLPEDITSFDIGLNRIAASSPRDIRLFSSAGGLQEIVLRPDVTAVGMNLTSALQVVEAGSPQLTVRLSDLDDLTNPADAVRIQPLDVTATGVATTSDSTPGQLSYLLSTSELDEVLEIGPAGSVVARYKPHPNLVLQGLNLDRAERPVKPMVVETSVTVEVVESLSSLSFDAFIQRWAQLVSQESTNLSEVYDPGYSYDGDDVNDITEFGPGFDLELGTPIVKLKSFLVGAVPRVSTVSVEVSRTVTEPTLNVVQNALTEYEMRLEHQTQGSDPEYLIQTQREVRNEITATTGSSPPAIPMMPTLMSFDFLQTNSDPLTSLPSGGTIMARDQVSGLFPVTGGTTEMGNVRFRLAGNDFPLQDQGGGLFTATVILPTLSPGLYAPTVVVENRRLAAPADFLNTSSASVAESRELSSP